MEEWTKLSKYVQSKMFKEYMHANNIQNGDYFKKMKSLISEGKSKHVVTYDPKSQMVILVDFKHELFVRERSKRKKVAHIISQSLKEQEEDALEVIDEEVFEIPSDVTQYVQNEQHVC